ncbi:hypothetical protein BgiBS90_023188 [Biomphalaria glabrata]|nr:hypothetical protein BgiBS90_023188 [Biomphalaria glabrata]
MIRGRCRHYEIKDATLTYHFCSVNKKKYFMLHVKDITAAKSDIQAAKKQFLYTGFTKKLAMSPFTTMYGDLLHSPPCMETSSIHHHVWRPPPFTTMYGDLLHSPPCMETSSIHHHVWRPPPFTTMYGDLLHSPPCMETSSIHHHVWRPPPFTTMYGDLLHSPPCMETSSYRILMKAMS